MNIRETIESEPDCEIVSCIYGFDLPFEENWNLGSFSTSDWVISSDNWIISVDTGNSAPSAVFEPEIPLTDYVESLESYYLNAFGMTEGYIFSDMTCTYHPQIVPEPNILSSRSGTINPKNILQSRITATKPDHLGGPGIPLISMHLV